jgi:hypothetical protein
VVRRALWTDRHGRAGPGARLAAWAAAPRPVVFPWPRSAAAPSGDAPPGTTATALAWRAALAQAADPAGTARDGPEPESGPAGQSDWLDRLDGQVGLLACLGSTAHPGHVPDALFDAFVLGALPLCHAPEGHHLHDLVMPGAILNLAELTPAAAAARLRAFRPDAAVAAAWIGSARALARRFRDATAVQRERQRIATLFVDALLALRG